MSSVRLRRLVADFEKLRDYVRSQRLVRLIDYEGDPPERYQLEYRIRSVRLVDEDLEWVDRHKVEIALPRNYPRQPPQCRMLSPVFHPNIAPHAICVGDHWSAGESLQSIVVRIGEMLAFQSYNVKSPLNGEAARWVEENLDELPLDDVCLLAEEDKAERPVRKAARTRQQTAPRQRTPADRPAEAAAESMVIECPECHARYRIPSRQGPFKVRCKRCTRIFEVTVQ